MSQRRARFGCVAVGAYDPDSSKLPTFARYLVPRRSALMASKEALARDLEAHLVRASINLQSLRHMAQAPEGIELTDVAVALDHVTQALGAATPLLKQIVKIERDARLTARD